MIFLLLITYLFYTMTFFYMKIHESKNQQKMIDLDSILRLQCNEIRKLNVEIIFLKEANEKLTKKRSNCSLDDDDMSEFSMAESETYILTKLRKNSISNGSTQSIKLDEENNEGDVEEFIWASNDWKFETGKLRGSLLNFIFKKRAKYCDGVKFHQILIFCTKQHNRKITDMMLSFTPSPDLVVKFPEDTCFRLTLQQAFEIELLVKQSRIIPNAQHWISIKLNYRIETDRIEDVLNVTFSNSWFIDFIDLRSCSLSSTLKKFDKEIFHQKFLLQKLGVENELSQIENLYRYEDKNKEKKYMAVFKELFFGDYVDFLLLLRIEGVHIFISIKMEKKDIKVELNNDELHSEFDYLILAIQEYFKDFI